VGLEWELQHCADGCLINGLHTIRYYPHASSGRYTGLVSFFFPAFSPLRFSLSPGLPSQPVHQPHVHDHTSSSSPSACPVREENPNGLSAFHPLIPSIALHRNYVVLTLTLDLVLCLVLAFAGCRRQVCGHHVGMYAGVLLLCIWWENCLYRIVRLRGRDLLGRRCIPILSGSCGDAGGRVGSVDWEGGGAVLGEWCVWLMYGGFNAVGGGVEMGGWLGFWRWRLLWGWSAGWRG
jgi:hypothetical protein